MTFKNILDKFRKYALSEKDKGDKFEKLMQVYLQQTPNMLRSFRLFGFGQSFLFAKNLGARTLALT